MSDDIADTANAAQAEMWAAAGPIWVENRERFDHMADDHGRAALDALAPAAGERVADIGCGAGSVTMDIAAAVGPSGRAIAVDISPTMIDGARMLAEQQGRTNVEFLLVDAMVDPIGSEIDGLYSRFGVMFFADPVDAFANLRRSLRPGGRMSFTCWQSAADNKWASVPLGIARNYVDLPFGPDPAAPGPFAFADPDRVTTVLTTAGFTDVAATANTTPIRVGSDADDAVSFLLGLQPSVRALAESAPDQAAALRNDVLAATAEWATGGEVMAPAASWIVTASNPG